MKIRNKETGKIIDSQDGEIMVIAPNEYPIAYKTINELTKDWEDVEGTNALSTPLIEDKEIRKVVRAWADRNDVVTVKFDAFWRGFRHNNSTITVWKDLPLEDNEIYTIEELCGSEEQ